MKTENTFIIHPETIEQENALKAFVKALKMKFEVAKEKPYDPEFVVKIQESRQQAKEGKTVKMALDDIWKE
ncbi:DUF2683 family protein [Algoriphagus sp.]|uniref:DUF2683 family protein n=1 Tax=Algoriphagus sp. TaxID=1872435 RepID=UPI0039189668